MKTRILGRVRNSERLLRVQVRQPSVRLPGSLAVYVASVAAPPPRASEATPSSVSHLSVEELGHPISSSNCVPGAAVAFTLTPAGNDTAAALSSEQAAKLERAASSGLATTSSGAAASLNVRRRRFSSAAMDNVGTTAAELGTGPHFSGARGAVRSFVRDSEFQPRAYTAQLAATSSVSELRSLFEIGRKHDLNAIHIATLWTRLAKIVSGPPSSINYDGRGVGAATANRAGPNAGGGGSRGPQPSEPAVLLAFVDELEAATTPAQLEEMAPRGLANVVWAAAKVKPEAAGGASSSSSGGTGAVPSCPDADMATLPSGSELGQGSEGGGSKRSRPLRIRGGKSAMVAMAAAAAAAAEKQAAFVAAGRLSSTVVSEALLNAWAAAAARKLSAFSMQDISNVVWALGRLGYQPRGLFMTQLCVALLKELPRADRPQQVSNVLLGLALLRFPPPIKDFWPPVWEAVQRLVLQEQKDNLDVQGVTNTLWALGQLRAECPGAMPEVPQPLVSKAVFRAVQYGDRLSGAQCQDVFVSLPRLGFEPSEYQASKLLALALRQLPDCDAQALSNIALALVKLRAAPRRSWKAAAGAAFLRQLPISSPEALARFLFAWAHMREPPPVWVPQAWARLHSEVDRLTAADIAFVILAANQMFERLPRRAKDAAAPQPASAQPDTQPDTQPAQEQQQLQEDSGSQGAEQAASPSSSSAEVGTAARRRRSAATTVIGIQARVPPRQFLLALRSRWEALGGEAQLSVVFEYRALVQEVFNMLGATE